MNGAFRIGQVSKIDYKTGMMSVVYKDMNGGDDVTTDLIPYIALNNEYHMPNVEDYVAVLHLSNGLETGIVLGRFWNSKNKPSVNGKDRYRKDFSNKPGKSYFERNPESGHKLKTDSKTNVEIGGSLVISADDITFLDNSGSTTLAQILNHMSSH